MGDASGPDPKPQTSSALTSSALAPTRPHPHPLVSQLMHIVGLEVRRSAFLEARAGGGGVSGLDVGGRVSASSKVQGHGLERSRD